MIDTHAHLSKEIDNEILVQNAKNNGVNQIVFVGYDVASSEKCLDFTKNKNDVYCAVGIHPDDCENCNSGAISRLSTLLDNKKCIAVGEIGLDYHYVSDNKQLQKQAFCSQIELAIKKSVPFIVHSRDACKDTFDIISSYKNQIKNGFLLHCYAESKEMVDNYLKLGGYFAFGGVVTFKNAKKDEIIKNVSMDRILCETDCPYMAPVPHRGEVNQPAFVTHVYDKIAQIYNVDKLQIITQMQENFKKLFNRAVIN